MSLAAYEDFVYGAGWLDAADPIAAWSAFADLLTDLTERLAGCARCGWWPRTPT